MYLFEGDNRRGAIGANAMIGLEDLIGEASGIAPPIRVRSPVAAAAVAAATNAAAPAIKGPVDGYKITLPGFATGANLPALAYIAAPPNATAEQMAAIAALPVAEQEKMAAANRAQVYQNIANGLLTEKNPDRQQAALEDPEIKRLATTVPGFMESLQAQSEGDTAATDAARLKMATTSLVEIKNQPGYAANNTNFAATSILPALQAMGSPLATSVAKAIEGMDTSAVLTATEGVALIQKNGGAPLNVNPPMALPTLAEARAMDTGKGLGFTSPSNPFPVLASPITSTPVSMPMLPSGGGSNGGGGSSYALNAQIREAVEARNAGMVVDQQMTSKRRYPLGFVPTDVLTGQTLNIPAAPQNLFRPERLVIPSDIAFDFGVTDIKVGNTSQFVQNTEVPAVLFSEVAINTNVYFDSANIGNQVSVQVRNKSAGTLNFTAGLIGAIAK